MVEEPCGKCGKRADRLLGTVAHCKACAEAFLAPIRQRVGVVKIHRPEVLGESSTIPGMSFLRCRACGATWDGTYFDECRWCHAREARMQDDERRRLLWPEWAANRNGIRYDELDDIDKQVWRKTRGQRTDADSIIAWAHNLSVAVANGDITADDAEQAIKRIGMDE